MNHTPRGRRGGGRSGPMVPDSEPIEKVLSRAGPLQLLQQRLRESTERFNAVRASLPPALLAHVKPGPLDDDQWTLLVSNQAVAAKLKHLQPFLESALNDQGWKGCRLRIKVMPT